MKLNALVGSGLFFAALALTASAAAAPGPNLVRDGSFEHPNVDGSLIEFTAPSSFGVAEQPWKVVAGNVDIHGTFQQAEIGNQSLDLNGDRPGTIEQDIPTAPGQTYLIRFWLAGNPSPACPFSIKRLTVSWAGSKVVTLSFDITGHSEQDMGWKQHTYMVTAQSSVTTLRFESLKPNEGDQRCGPMLDRIKVRAVS